MDNNNNTIIIKDSRIIYEKITELINKNFNKLNILHKKILTKNLYKLILIFSLYYYNNNFIAQLFMNNYQDIFSILVLLLPYYELNQSKNILTLDELFINSNSKAKSLSSSYYIDHQNFKTDPNYLKDYFNSLILSVSNTLYQTHCLCLPNWCNIFPYTMLTYKTSNIFKNFKDLYNNKGFKLEQPNELIYINYETDEYEIKKNIFQLGYSILYGTIYNFLYMDIRQIKWMIYDININSQYIIPNIIYLGNKLSINNIINKPWDKLTFDEKINLKNKWEKFYQSDSTDQISLKSLILFYLRWEKDNDNLKQLKISDKCLDIIGNNLNKAIEENNIIKDNQLDDENEVDVYESKTFKNCLKQIYPKINYENLYNYIYESIQKFRYTWYGYMCLNEDKSILDENSFFDKYFLNSDVIITNSDEQKKYIYLSPKNVYNYFKSLIHMVSNDKYIELSSYGKWDNLSFNNKLLFISRLTNDETINNWFRITGNITRTYKRTVNQNVLMSQYIDKILNTDLIVNIIIQTLVYNGMFNYYKYNPVMTDTSIIPDKNLRYDEYKSYILNNVDIKSFEESYHQFSNTMLNHIEKNTIETIEKSMWYTNFGANWIAQIQLFHHYLHNRVLFITGATGAGKSTVSPFLLVYGIKILNFNNNARVVCTQPRTQPTIDNAVRIADSIGLPIELKSNTELDKTNELYRNTPIGEGIKKDINYIQYKHMGGNFTDELYHPCLRLYTDGSLYNIVKENYFFKKSIESDNKLIESSNISDNKNYLSTNIFDMILVDEAHEHNTNMDMILTLCRFGIYINNQVSLGIISATMDDDEIIYRKYYQLIDDNWKAPLNINYYNLRNLPNELKKFIPNMNLIDRRIHLSIPFGGMNFDVKEFPSNLVKYPPDAQSFSNMKKINSIVIQIVKHILNTSSQGDILIFQPGESDIKKLVTELNLVTPSNVIAVPFYSKLNKEILENVVKKVAKPDVRKQFRYDKNKYDITQMFKIPLNEWLPAGTYNRFIIIATNIAEASITVDSLVFVIDTGNQKVSVYDPETGHENLETREIAIPNQKQRKGRVGRVKPGIAYYTYDRTKLGEKVVYKMNIQNINSIVLDLVTSSDHKFIDANSDPYKVTTYTKIPECLRTQYIFLTEQNIFSLYSNNLGKDIVLSYANKILYPYSDGKYQLESLIDETGKFYIIHPNEDYWLRNPETLEIISKNVKPNYSNKITKSFEYGKTIGLIGIDNMLTPYGKLINAMSEFMEFSENSIDFTKIILDGLSFNIQVDSEVFKNLLMFIVFRTTTFTFKVSNYLTGKADYLIYSRLINDKLFNAISFDDIKYKFDSELKNFTEVITGTVSNLISNNYKNELSQTKTLTNLEQIQKALISYYMIKLKMEIINYNLRYLEKKTFDEIITIIVEQKKSYTNSTEYNNIAEKILFYYNQSDKFLKRSVIIRLKEPLEELNEKNSRYLYEKINKVLYTSSIYKNDFLNKINLNANKRYSNELTEQFNNLSDYDKICFIIIKNFPQNILVKVPYTEFYIDYFNKNINKIYMLDKINIELSTTKTISFTKTKVGKDIRNYFIFGMGMNDIYDLESICFLSEYVVAMLENYLKLTKMNLHKKNIVLNENLCRDLYQDKFDKIKKKIDKIIEYIKSQ